jgi:hypothetical protein
LLRGIIECSQQDVELLALSVGGVMGARLAGESVQLTSYLTRVRFPIECRHLAVHFRTISDELPHEHAFVSRVLAR